MEIHQEEYIRGQAKRLFSYPLIEDSSLLESGAIENPVRILTPAGEMHSWFVPVVITQRLAGFFQFDHTGEFMRFSSFNTSPGVFDACPLADNWLSKDKIGVVAESLAYDDEILATPFLSYDGSPERIAWLVKARRPNGECRNLMVTGEVVYVGSEHTSHGY